MYIANSYKEIDYDLINSKIKNGAKLRLDIGTSICSPVTKFWLDNCPEDIFVIGFDPNPDCVYKENFWDGKYLNIPNTFKIHKKSDFYYHIIGALDNVPAPTKSSFYRTTFNVGCSSLLKPIIQNIQGCSLDDTIDVDVFSAADILKNIDVEHVEMVKIDAQGKDLDIVKSFNEYLNKVVFLDVESDSSMYYENAPNFNVINNEISNLGFTLYLNLHYNLRYKNNKFNVLPDGFNNITGAM